MLISEKKYIKNSAEYFKIKTIINNNCLEDNIIGFKTIDVKGRDILPIKGKLEEPEGGLSYIRDNSFKSRIIEIEFIIRTKNYNHLMRACESLNNMLIMDKDVEIYFSDDRFRYYGQVIEITSSDSFTNWVKGSIKIGCCDYKKYGENVIQQDISVFNYDYLTPIIPTKITITCIEAVYNIGLTNLTTGTYIKLNNNFNKNDKIEIYPKEQKIVKGSENLLKYLDIRSNLEDFFISYGDKIYASGCSVDIEFCEVKV